MSEFRDEMTLGQARDVPRHALIYDGRLLRLEGELVGIRDCLGDKFDYDELMSG